jgi:lysophospholipase L1-like esterase
MKWPAALSIAFGLCLTGASQGAPALYRSWLAIGDSITEHGPAEQLGWVGENRGMAASDVSRDYVHVLQKLLQEKQPGNATEIRIAGRVAKMKAGTIEGVLAVADELRASPADLVTIQLGENDHFSEMSREEFARRYRLLVEKILAMRPLPKIVCTGVWSPGDTLEGSHYAPHIEAGQKDAIIQEICREFGLPFVSVAKIAADPKNSGDGDDPGVRWHPNDQGMLGYAEAIFHVLYPES